MANFASRSAQLRYFRRYLCSRALNQCSSTQPSPPLKFCNHFSSQSVRISASTIYTHYLVNLIPGKGKNRIRAVMPEKAVRGGPVSWLSFLLLIFTGAGLVFYYDNEKKRHIEEINASSTAVKEGPSAGKAAIGGPFNLINDEGKNVADAVDKIKAKIGVDIVPVFISVDPERDTVEQVHEYVKEFHPNLIGLTGNRMRYLMGPKMDFVKNFGKNNDVDSLANGIMEAMKKYKP
ncbi:Protein SCO1-like 1, mitochondrial [Vitis vinifera]|uniref:Protein SCO1-like 1, mitochondrial n=1 Tax=Vitis vinifera TaxID=29760 RepID=A0A438DAL6_VITVI|nr:Protein SCO1-like 1, mitochondrial [Vitis vinifera]